MITSKTLRDIRLEYVEMLEKNVSDKVRINFLEQIVIELLDRLIELELEK